MKITAHIRGTDCASDRKVKHFAEGLGARLESRNAPVESDLVIQWGYKPTPALAGAQEKGTPFIILENGVWGERSRTYSWAYNGLHNRGYVPTPPVGRSRYAPELGQWKDPHDGDWIIFGQVENDRSLEGGDVYAWAEYMQERWPQATFREHPKMLSETQASAQEPFEDALDRCSLAITYSSTVGPQAVIRGIPTVAASTLSLATDVSGRTVLETVDEPWRNRRQWIHELSWRHIYMEEDVPAAYILSGYEYALANG